MHRSRLGARAWVLAVALIAPLAGACGGDDDDTGAAGSGGGGGGAAAATATQVAALLGGKSCASCHMGAPNAANGGLQVNFGDKAALVALVGKASPGASGSMCGGKQYVVAGQPNSSILYTKLTSTPGCGVQMPLGGMPLSASEQGTISSWIMGGARSD